MGSITLKQGHDCLIEYFQARGNDPASAGSLKLCLSHRLGATPGQGTGLIRRMAEKQLLEKLDRGLYRIPEEAYEEAEDILDTEIEGTADQVVSVTIPVEMGEVKRARIQNIIRRNVRDAMDRIQLEASKELLHMGPEQFAELQRALRQVEDICG